METYRIYASEDKRDKLNDVREEILRYMGDIRNPHWTDIDAGMSRSYVYILFGLRIDHLVR